MTRNNIMRLKDCGIRVGILTTLVDDAEVLVSLAEFVALVDAKTWRIDVPYQYAGHPRPNAIVSSMGDALDALDRRAFDLRRVLYGQCGHTDGCGAGERIFAIDQDGWVYACHTQIGRADPLGSVLANVSLSSLLARPFERSGRCAACALESFCHGGCPLWQEKNERMALCDVPRLIKERIYAEL
jgi:radical SAM protein with 4Fe4S-binding SPASM domain